ncbi:MAG: chromosomal replication initiator protein DnaA [Clostridiales bacterium]|nr:chromosomal replication initiator protein DnaA [Clostridiales bacterium]
MCTGSERIYLDHQQLWERACQLLNADMKEVTFNTWIKTPLTALGMKDHVFYISAATDMYQQIVTSRYIEKINNALSQAADEEIRAEILTPVQAENYKQGAQVNQRIVDNANLNPRYTFESFVVGNNNRLAHAASLAVADVPGGDFNPLFIYGGAGLGKTHLMHAIGHFALEQNPNLRIRYVTTEVFTNEMIAAIQSRTMAEFRAKYRNIDMLLVDDIQFLAGRDGTQEEFFHTFNALHSAGRQVVVTSDKSPKEIQKMDERLISRLEWGMVADIAKPDEETRFEILRRKTVAGGIKIEESVLHKIAQKVSSNIRELEGCLTRLIAYSNLTGKTIDEQLTEEALRDIFQSNEPRRVSCDDVISAVAGYYNVRVEDIKGPRRNREITVPRQIAMYLCREMVDVSLEMIGTRFNRDHSTVMHACQKVVSEKDQSPSLASLLRDLTKQLQERT